MCFCVLGIGLRSLVVKRNQRFSLFIEALLIRDDSIFASIGILQFGEDCLLGSFVLLVEIGFVCGSCLCSVGFAFG